MIPDFYIGSIQIQWYPLIVILTIIACVIFSLYHFNKMQGLKLTSKQIILYISLIAIIGFIGARILSIVEHVIVADKPHHFNDFVSLLFGNGGFSWYGGFLLILCLFPFLLLILSKEQFLYLLDSTALVCCLGYALGRFACLVSGDGCYGKWTNLPWGMHFPYGVSPSLFPVHPTSLYESIIHFILFFFLLRDKNKRFLGETFSLFIFFTAIARFGMEFIRINEKIGLGLTSAQWISLLLIGFSIISYFYLKTYSSIRYQLNKQTIK